MLKRVENELFLMKDPMSGTVLNTDKQGYEAIMANKNRRLENEKSLRNEIDELKAIVASLIKDR